MTPISPRLLRLTQAAAYLGMARGVFNSTVRPYLPELRIGAQGVAFDRNDLDRWIEDHKQNKTRVSERSREVTAASFQKALAAVGKRR